MNTQKYYLSEEKEEWRNIAGKQILSVKGN